jgi:hypothetical protein
MAPDGAISLVYRPPAVTQGWAQKEHTPTAGITAPSTRRDIGHSIQVAARHDFTLAEMIPLSVVTSETIQRRKGLE